MKKAKDYRSFARENLRGKWGIAVFAGLIAGLLGGADVMDFNFNFDISGFDDRSFHFEQSSDFSFIEEILSSVLPFLIGTAIYIGIFALIFAVLYFMLGSIINLGYTRFNLNLVDGKKPEIGTIFEYFPHWKVAVVARLWQTLYIFLWSLLFLIPGIIALYRYSMTSYILAENPDMDAREAIDRSSEMMRGNKWRLFCLEFSFIGWGFLSALTLGIGSLWLHPYVQASTAIFYRDISGTGWAMHEAEQAGAGTQTYTGREF